MRTTSPGNAGRDRTRNPSGVRRFRERDVDGVHRLAIEWIRGVRRDPDEIGQMHADLMAHGAQPQGVGHRLVLSKNPELAGARTARVAGQRYDLSCREVLRFAELS